MNKDIKILISQQKKMSLIFRTDALEIKKNYNELWTNIISRFVYFNFVQKEDNTALSNFLDTNNSFGYIRARNLLKSNSI